MQTRLFFRRLAVRMVFVALLAMAATAFGLLLYDQLQPTSQTSLADRPASPETPGPGPARVSTVPKAPSDLSRSPESPPQQIPPPLPPRPSSLAPLQRASSLRSPRSRPTTIRRMVPDRRSPRSIPKSGRPFARQFRKRGRPWASGISPGPSGI